MGMFTLKITKLPCLTFLFYSRVGHILNVTREIDNFFPGTFDYLNIRVYDDEKTDLLKHWDNTYKYISKAKKDGSKVLVHCKMGVSRSASVVIAYAMKAYNWDFQKALKHVKEKRSCIKPNSSFISQLETYQGILDAMKNKEKLQRSKSETNLKLPGHKNEKVLVGSEPTPIIQTLAQNRNLETTVSGQDLRHMGTRPKSWSPDNIVSSKLLLDTSQTVFLSLENLNQRSVSKESLKSLRQKCLESAPLNRNVLMPCDNGESYSVSPNQIRHLPGQHHDSIHTSVKERINELESQKEKKNSRKKLVLNIMTQFASNHTENESSSDKTNEEDAKLRTVLDVKEIWDPGENRLTPACSEGTTKSDCDLLKPSVSDEQTVWTSSAVLRTGPETVKSNTNTVPESVCGRTKTIIKKDGDPFSHQLDRVFDREERKQQRMSLPVLPACVCEISQETRDCPSRQSSWSSYDSAVVLGYQGESREAPSRHSSWGSGDTRTLPSRNSSWGSYDMRHSGPIFYVTEKGEKVTFPYDKEDIPWHPGTVKRTKQKLEENAKKINPEINESSVTDSETVQAFNKTLIRNYQNQPSSFFSAISSKMDIVKKKQKDNISGLSLSAPETSTMELIKECSLSRSVSNLSTYEKSNFPNHQSTVKQHKFFLENLKKDPSTTKRTAEEIEDETISGIVRSRKKEFEAKTNLERLNQNNLNSSEVNLENLVHKNKINSLPSSPVSVHSDKELNDLSSTSDPGDDLNFKKLIGKFEISDKNHQDTRSNRSFLTKNVRNSLSDAEKQKIVQTSLIANFNKNNSVSDKSVDGDFKRPPVMPVVRSTQPNVMVATVIAKATKKQQQFGKTHPLARLNIKPRHNNPVYNTM